jgi:hypothetical protein
MNVRKTVAGGAFIGLALTACSQRPQGGGELTNSTLRFDSSISAGTVASCGEGEETGGDFGVGLQPYYPDSKDVYTYGIASSEREQLAEPLHANVGASMRIIGKTTVEIVTSDDKPGVSHIVDLAHASFAQIVHGTDQYDVAMTVRGDTMFDNGGPEVVMEATCLDHGNFTPKPHVPVPEIPGTIAYASFQ